VDTELLGHRRADLAGHVGVDAMEQVEPDQAVGQVARRQLRPTVGELDRRQGVLRSGRLHGHAFAEEVLALVLCVDRLLGKHDPAGHDGDGGGGRDGVV
jgi:hypothetical protein